MLIPSHRSPGFRLRQPKQPMTRIAVRAPGYTSSARLPLEGGSAIPWAQKDKRDVCLLTNLHDPPREGNYRNEHGNVIKPAIVADYNRHMGHVDKADRMANSYTASHRTWKWTQNLFFHLFDLGIVNSYILLSACGGKKISHRNSHLTLIKEMLALSGH